MNALLRKYIRATLRVIMESRESGDSDDGLLVEPDDNPGEKSEENTLAGGGIGGVTAPLGAGPTYPDEPKQKKKKKKRKSDVGSRSFGGGDYRD